jgi:hypothetical protein
MLALNPRKAIYEELYFTNSLNGSHKLLLCATKLIVVLSPPGMISASHFSSSTGVRTSMKLHSTCCKSLDNFKKVPLQIEEVAEEHAPSVELYEAEIRDPKKEQGYSGLNPKKANGIEVESEDTQQFLAGQLDRLEQYRIEDEREKLLRDSKKTAAPYMSTSDDRRDLEEHIGPVQFNMDGIQVDADDILKRLKVRNDWVLTKLI